MRTITVKDLRRVFEDCWFRIITSTEGGEEIVIFDQEIIKSNIPSFLEELPVKVAYIDNNEETIVIYIYNNYEKLYEEEN